MSHGPPIAGSYATPAAGEEDRRPFLRRYAGLPENGFSWKSVLLAIFTAFFALQLGLIVVSLFDRGIDTNAGKAAAQAMVIIAFGGTAIAFAADDAAGRIRDAIDRFGLRRFALWMIGLAAVAWFAYAILQGSLSSLIHPEQDDVTKELGTDDTSALSIAVTAILVVAGAALSAELLFRGVIFAGLRNSMSLWPAALISSVLWAALHLTAANLAVVGVLAIFGLVLAWLYERTGTLWTPICAHAINNGLAVLVLFLS